ncbi:hypothetical protein AXF42_Ash019384 [Apostasia shenzhenica]|uniref:Uncharacterized protein n=1 Tax=Apostasia shenzhenica TaxID=1088818 RepID=A0A2H9ZTN2_9ASPA|nr:hypothetical protein AXF42_Ash019384 [Apostasia shenzhenica]
MLDPRQGTEAIEIFYAEYSDCLESNTNAKKASVFTTLQHLFSLYYSDQIMSRNVQRVKIQTVTPEKLSIFSVLKSVAAKRFVASNKGKATVGKQSITQSQSPANLNELQFYLYHGEKFNDDMSL